MNKVLENIISRVSTRSFTSEPIEREKLDMILQAGIHAPSGMNRQSWQFTVLTKEKDIQHLAGVVAAAANRGESYDFYKPSAIILLSNEEENTNGLADCACALENIFLMSNELGIGSCWINQLKGICGIPEVRRELDYLGIPKNHAVWGMAALGYTEVEKEQKKRSEAVIKYV